MISTRDYSYIHTKKVLLGEEKLSKDIQELMYYINEKFDFYPINIVVEQLDNDKETKRIEIVFKEGRNEIGNTRDGNFRVIGEKDICEKYRSIVSKRFYRKDKFKYFCVFSSFKRVYIDDIASKISDKELEDLAFKHNLWQIRKFVSGYHCFYFNDTDINEDTNKIIENELQELFKSRNPKTIYDDLEVGIYFTSEENLINNYENNMFYYYKDH